MAFNSFSKRDHMEITTLGLEFASAEIIGVWSGYWLDGRLGSAPWLLVAGAVAGFALGFYIIIRAAKNMSRENATLKKADKKDGRS